MKFDSGRYYLVYFEELLHEYWEIEEGVVYDRDVLRHEWKKYLRIEEFETLDECFNRAADLILSVDYDHSIEFIGVFKGAERIYPPDYVSMVANEICDRRVFGEQEVTA